jgi:hypothetical protein
LDDLLEAESSSLSAPILKKGSPAPLFLLELIEETTGAVVQQSGHD